MTLTPEQLNYLFLALASIAGYAVKHLGFNVPILHQLLVALFPDKSGTPATPAVPGTHPILDTITSFVTQIINHPTMTPAEKTAAINQVVTAVPAAATKPA